MNRLLRYCKFNVVGAMGMGVQLGSLAVLSRSLSGHYLLASGAAVELAVVHNFIWHERYTWRDRKAHVGAAVRFVRFQVGNGMVSLVGNVALMRLLVHRVGLPILPSNVLAIACCSVANFWVGEMWAFRRVVQLEG